MFDAVKERLAPLQALGGRIEPAASLSDLMARNQLPQVTPAAFVLPLALRGGRADAAANLYRQQLVEMLGIVLILRTAGDATGGRGTDRLTSLRNDVIRRIVGWSPPSHWRDDEAIGVFTFARGELVSLSTGALVYQIDFALEDQLRI